MSGPGRAPAPLDVQVLGVGALELPGGAQLPRRTLAAPPVRLQRLDRLCGLALCAADEALDRASQAGDVGRAELLGSPPRERAGVVFGTAWGCHATDEAYERGRQMEGPSPRLFSYTLPSSPVGEIAIHYGLRGPALCLASGLTAGLSALREAQRALRRGRADHLLCCAAEVTTPLLQELEGPAAALRDSAAALLLGRGGAPAGAGWLGPVATAFRPEDPVAALRAAVAAVLDAAPRPPQQVLGDGPSLACLRSGDLPCPAEERPCAGAAGALLTLAALPAGPHDAALVVQTDGRGHGAAALWIR